ncbi:Sugar phosphate permease [Desulfitobacterium sp. LBE]|uniref:Major facilitator superfamily MFS_1 n=2 Tax=root TaxID=1 RepID=B8G0V3_DESHD|nr:MULTISPECIES: MFS transporter [Desulfitobacterium]ACL18372.1 major facilitator superfamily MFS_1 [Desulfitobacterium hafniense DCB-2]MEA5023660.1 MFS transporter [Desulfitobacterium hafniense]TWH58700.1 Sugar phosphate permease [Desulfitobacterium sp. LBE]
MNAASNRLHHAFLIVVACCAMSLTCSITWNTAGIFFVPILQELGVPRGSLALYLTIVSFSAMLFLPAAGQLLVKFNARKLLSVFVLINAVAVGAMSTYTSVFHFYIGAVFLGVSQAFFLYIATPTMITRWFKARTGFFTGLCMAFTGIGAIIFNPIGGYIIATLGWRSAYLAFGLFIGVVVFPLVALLIRNDPRDMGLLPYGEKSSAEASGNGPEGKYAPVITGVPVSVAVKSSAFYVLLLFLASVALFTDINVYYPSIVTSLGQGAVVASTVGSASMFGALVGKVVLGWINDKSVVGGILFSGISGVAGVAMITFIGTHNATFFLIGAFLYGFGFAQATVQSPVLTRKIFGDRYFTQVYSIVMMFYAAASAIGQSLYGYIADFNGGSYIIPLLMVMGLAAAFTIFGITAYSLRKSIAFDNQ